MNQGIQIRRLRCFRSSDFRLRVDSLNFEPGTITAVIGPNGSGKTTLINCLIGLVAFQSGAIYINGHCSSNNIKITQENIGFVPDDENWFIKELTAKEYLEVLKRIYIKNGLAAKAIDKRIRHVAVLLNFSSYDVALEQLSHGNKKKVQIIAALMHSPKILILDEVRNGLDALAIIALEEIIKSELTRGVSVIVTSHDLWWTERIADNYLLLSNGNILFQGRREVLLKKYRSVENMFITLLNKSTHL